MGKMTSADETTRRRSVLLQRLTARMKELFTEKHSSDNRNYKLNLVTTCNELQPCVSNHVKKMMENHQFWLDVRYDREEEMHAYAAFMKKIVNKVECLGLFFFDGNEAVQADFIEAALCLHEVRRVHISVGNEISERTRDE